MRIKFTVSLYLWNLWADRTWYEGHWADLKGGSYHDEEVCLVLVDGHRLVELVAEAFAEENDVRFHNTLACGGLRGDTQVRPLSVFCYVSR